MAKDYKNKVSYLEEPYFFNEWYGFFYYCNESEKTFVMEKNFAGCLGLKVVNWRVPDKKAEVMRLRPGESKIYILKRTQNQVKFIPLGKVLPSTDL